MNANLFSASEATTSTPVSTYFYNNCPITFEKGSSVMVNATEMAKPFGKRPVDWLRLPSTQTFIKQLSEVRKSHNTNFVVTAKGNSSEFEQGTWLHEDVALEFARWLSPAFAIWCNDRIKELLTIGMTATQPTIDEMVDNPDLVIKLATQLKKQREANAALQNQIEQDAPRVLFSKAVETAKRSVLVAELAKILQQNGINIGQNRLFEWLRNNGYLCSKGIW